MSECIKTHGENGHPAQNPTILGSECQNLSNFIVKPAIRLKLSHFRGRDVRMYQIPWRKRPFGSKKRILCVGISEMIKTHGANGHSPRNPAFKGSECQNLSKPMAKTATVGMSEKVEIEFFDNIDQKPKLEFEMP